MFELSVSRDRGLIYKGLQVKFELESDGHIYDRSVIEYRYSIGQLVTTSYTKMYKKKTFF